VKRGRHAAADGSFARSASVNAGRGAALIIGALLIGFLLLRDVTNDGGYPKVFADKSAKSPAAPSTTLPTLPSTTGVPAHAPKDVKVLVVNATTTNGAGATVGDVLKQRGGYTVSGTVSASAQLKVATKQSVIYYVSKDYEPDAQALRAALSLPPTAVQALPAPPPVSPAGANVIVIVGPDLAQSIGSRSTGSTTTARGATTTTARASTTTSR
jgi:hypothetical protein